MPRSPHAYVSCWYFIAWIRKPNILSVERAGINSRLMYLFWTFCRALQLTCLRLRYLLIHEDRELPPACQKWSLAQKRTYCTFNIDIYDHKWQNQNHNELTKMCWSFKIGWVKECKLGKDCQCRRSTPPQLVFWLWTEASASRRIRRGEHSGLVIIAEWKWSD